MLPVVETVARPATPLIEALARLRLPERARFLYEFARDPRATGAISPSSPDLAAAMVSGMGVEEAQLVVELGAGTGVFTAAAAARLKPGARLLALELNPRLAESLRERFDPAQVEIVCTSAEYLCRQLERREVGTVDAVLCGLPWVFIPTWQQRIILGEVHRALRPGGRFATFAYAHAAWLPKGVKFRRELRQVFPNCAMLPVIWRNLPPAFIYRCVKGRPSPGRRPGL